MTEDRLAALAARRATRDKHPARSARVLVAGVSVSALASLVSAFTVQAATHQADPTPADEPDIRTEPAIDTILPPTQPAPAVPVRHVVEVDIVQPPTPVAAAVTQPIDGSQTRNRRDSTNSTGGGTGGGGTGGGGSSGSSGGSR